MSDDAQDPAGGAAATRKRVRVSDQGGADAEEEMPGPAPEIEEDDDEDDIGPMPMSADGAGDGAVRKKRKVLPHERLFLDHLPSADRYSKSFMHRDVLNYVIMTK
ncbi:hypothetical protein FS749_002293 [Ceratobasidium sp. UAMH 11750]|nr:hypothetical protein FS749_002293 [Ceratobasidium sp. UAMH 11750]